MYSMEWTAGDKSRYDIVELTFHDAWTEVKKDPGFVINYWLFENAYFLEGKDLFYFRSYWSNVS